MEILNKTRQSIVDNLKESLENDSFFRFVEKWKGNHNPITKTEYKGINKLLLSYMMFKNNWEDNRFLTFNQIKQNPELSLKKDSKGVPIEYWYLFDKKEKVSMSFYEAKIKGVNNDEIGKGNDKRYSPCSRCYYVFNARDIEGIAPLNSKNINNIELKAENTLLNYCNSEKITINHSTDQASYSDKNNIINIPIRSNFLDNKSYLQVLAHEIIHSTGNEKRLDRDLKNSFGSEKYALEELKAEIGSSILCSELSIQENIEDSNKAYVKSWLKCIDENPNEFLKVINDTLKAVDYVEEKGEMDRIYSHSENINIINQDMMNQIIETREPEKKYLLIDESNNVYVCCDNRTGDAWTEEFDNLNDAFKWLNDYIEMKNQNLNKKESEMKNNDER